MMVILLFMGYKYINTCDKKNKIKAWIILGASFVLSILLLMSSDMASRRISQAVIEFQQAEKNASENIVTSIGQRVIFWENTLEMVPQYFFFGTGTGGFQEAYSKQVINKSGLEGVITQDPHNQYLKILIEQGIIGLFIFIKILTNAIYQKNINDENYIIGTSVICIWILTSLFNAHFTTFMEGTFIWAWLGLMNKYRKNP
jgi:O-antigen ligase